jgi:hypothetical protein
MEDVRHEEGLELVLWIIRYRKAACPLIAISVCLSSGHEPMPCEV